jgi:hypothetical protein
MKLIQVAAQMPEVEVGFTLVRIDRYYGASTVCDDPVRVLDGGGQ